MSDESKSERDREHDFTELIAESEAVRDEVAHALPSILLRLDRLTDELRRRGRFPVAGQIDRESRGMEFPAHDR